MHKFRTSPLRNLCRELTTLSAAFPNFHYAELSGPAIAVDDVLGPAVKALSGGSAAEVTAGVEGAYCLYGQDLDRAIVALGQMADDIGRGVRLVAEQFPSKSRVEEFPIVRGAAAPFLVAGAMMRLIEGFADRMKDVLEPLGIEVRELPGAPRVVRGVPKPDDGGKSITFPGEVIAPRPTGANWRRLIPAVTRGDLRVTHTTTPVFRYVGGYFGAELTLMRLIDKLPESSAMSAVIDRATHDRQDQANAVRSKRQDGVAQAPSDDSTLRIDQETFTVHAAGSSITFENREIMLFTLLARIAQRPGHHVTFASLRAPGEIWGQRVVEDSTIKGAISRLRAKLSNGGLVAVAARIKTGTYQDRRYVLLRRSLDD